MYICIIEIINLLHIFSCTKFVNQVNRFFADPPEVWCCYCVYLITVFLYWNKFMSHAWNNFFLCCSSRYFNNGRIWQGRSGFVPKNYYKESLRGWKKECIFGGSWGGGCEKTCQKSVPPTSEMHLFCVSEH